MIRGIDHVQVNAPQGHEQQARAFFSAFLGLPEVQKPDVLRANGGVWFGLPDGRQIHTGVAEAFIPSEKGHVCLFCDDLDVVLARAEEFGVVWSLDVRLPLRRIYLSDPWGNRMEIVEGRHASPPHPTAAGA
ncbi:glyoxalase (plasmid) [Deinococcus taeanensis]|uniref:glyoxalase n=1 Tax=Deinococcus taeanensis TaxID=2737050 RepID=UPI001CDC32B1|nr:glyoxalase [Deinococcus taeanensis]UBV44449.1 glyoxalase [Deinococcus taeanensis]